MTDKQPNDKEAMFIQLLLADPKLNPTNAAKGAGYAKSTAEKKAPMWVGKSRESCPKDKLHVWDAVQQAKAERIERTQVDADYLLKRLFAELEADLGDIYHPNGALKPIHDWPEIWRKGLVAGVETEQQYSYQDGERVPDGVIVKVKLASRDKIKQQFGDHIAIQAFKKQMGLDLSGVAELVRRARKRREATEE